MRGNKGFTLVELIVAMLVATIVASGMIIIFRLAFKQGRDTRVEAQLQIETQQVANRLENDLKDAIKFEYKDDVLTIEASTWSEDSKSIVPFYYYYIFRDNKVFVKSSNKALKDDTHVYEQDCLASNITFFDIDTLNLDSTSDDYEPITISFTVTADEVGIEHTVTRVVKTREGET